MVVSKENYYNVVSELKTKYVLSIDTETTGLYPFNGDRLFSIAIASNDDTYYFNFQSYPEKEEYQLTSFQPLIELCADPVKKWFAHNAKFDLHFLAKEGIYLPGFIHDTMVVARLLYNNHFTYGLADCALRVGLEKSSEVDDYIKKNRLYDGKGKERKKLFSKVPFDIISRYAEKDAEITYKLGAMQDRELTDKLNRVYANEEKFLKTALEIESTGVKINKEYVLRAIEFERKRCHDASRRIQKLTSMEFTDGRKFLQHTFRDIIDELPKTPKGSPSFDDNALKTIKDTHTVEKEIANSIITYRDHFKKLNSYYSNFIKFSDQNDVVHPSIRQAGTATGRISVVDPALQTVNKEDANAEEETGQYTVRKSFIPREGYFFVEMDYKAMEFRLLLDYAGERKLSRKIKEGFDPHQATADLVGIGRREAKTISFGLLYGMGIDKLAKSLGIPASRAKELRRTYFDALPLVENFILAVTSKVRRIGSVFNWLGRTSHFKDPNFAYKAVNYLIQGSGADIVKVAMNDLAVALRPRKSRMVLQVHDSILFEIHFSEWMIIPELKEIMEKAYEPRKCLGQEVSVEFSLQSWGNLKEFSSLGWLRKRLEEEGVIRSKNNPDMLGGEDSASHDSRDTGHTGLH